MCYKQIDNDGDINSKSGAKVIRRRMVETVFKKLQNFKKEFLQNMLILHYEVDNYGKNKIEAPKPITPHSHN